MATLSFSMSVGYSSPALPSIRQRMGLSDSQSDWFGGLLNFGGMLGSLAGGKFLKLIGGKNTMLFSMGVIITGWICIFAGTVPGVLFTGRLITGVTMGLVSISCPLFVSEVSPKNIRGLLNTLCFMAFNLGVLMSYVLGKWLAYDWLAVASIVPAVLTALILPWLAESPRWLLQVGHREAARLALQSYRGFDIDGEFKDMKDNVDNAEEFRLSELKQPSLYWPISIILLGLFLQQFTGGSVLMFYTEDIFATAGSILSAADSSIIVGTVPLLSVGVAAVLTDRLGRKMLLLLSLTMCAVSLAALGTFYHFKLKRDASFVESLGWLPLSSICIYFLGYSVGLRPVPPLLLGEMLPLRVKGFASGVLMCFFFACAAVTTLQYHPMLMLFGEDGIFWLYASFAVAGFVLIAAFMRETNGKSLEEIEELFQRKQTETQPVLCRTP
ncbi:facilitated trehalose transporter Tret1-like [Ixodes scapularis]|uniref:facilitated trehalose transporter Tret1-like n=1 Tax=Ixodes scapularis TaxID=6945 RepID=UPI001A9FA8E4|nr:facilitated trehalose transporter Tret1-like [Ixodes scapularis]